MSIRVDCRLHHSLVVLLDKWAAAQAISRNAAVATLLRNALGAEPVPDVDQPHKGRPRKLRNDWVLVDGTGVAWPGVLPYRDRHSRVGYPTREDAEQRRYVVIKHYMARHGSTPGQLVVRQRVGDDLAPTDV